MNLFDRKLRTPFQVFRLTVINFALLLGIELLLRHWMSASDVVSVLFATGPTAPLWKVSLAICFVLIRLIVWLILPGIVARDLFLLLVRERGPTK